MTPDTPTLPAWAAAWRAVAKYLPTSGLQALAEALRSDSPAVQQGGTTWAKSRQDYLVPLNAMLYPDVACAAACPVGYAAWKGDESIRTVEDVRHAFALAYSQGCADLGYADAGRVLLNWIDSTERGEMRARLLVEVEAVLAERGDGK